MPPAKQNNTIAPRLLCTALFVCALVMCALAQPVLALPEDREQPLQITAEHNAGDVEGNLVYTGNVKISQGSLQLQADKVIAQLNQQTINCTGKPAAFRMTTEEYGLVTGKADQLYFDRSTGKLKLSSNAILTKADGSFTEGDAITYNIDSETWTVEGGTTVLPPAVKKDNADGDS